MCDAPMIHCKDCIHAKPNIDEADKIFTLHCKLTEYHDYSPEHPESLAVASGEDGYWGILEVRPEFGCIQGRIE